MKALRIVAILLSAVGCASANQTSLRDPAHPHPDVTKVAVFVAGIDPGNALSIEKRVCATLVPEQCVAGKALLPSRQSYLPREIAQSLTGAKVDGVLVVVLGDDQTASAYKSSVLSQPSSPSSPQSGAAALYQNIAIWNSPPQRTIAESVAAVPLYTYDRKAHAVVGLIDLRDGKTVWGGQLNVSAQGEASVLDRDFIDTVTRELAAQLRQNHLVAPAAAAPNAR